MVVVTAHEIRGPLNFNLEVDMPNLTRATLAQIIALLSMSIAAVLTACGGSGNSSDQVAPEAPQAAVDAVLNYTRPDLFGVLAANDVLVPMRDGGTLTCNIVRPAQSDGTAAPGKFPGLVTNYDVYGRTLYAFGNDLRSFAAKGYNVVWCNTRGSNGFSGASPAPNSPGLPLLFQDQEQQDNYDLVEWLASQPWANGRVGQIGTSYGGITTLLVAGRQKPPSLKAIIPIMGSNDVYHFLSYPNGVNTLTAPPTNFAANCAVNAGEPTCATRNGPLWAGHPTFDQFWQSQITSLSDVQVPTLFVDGTQDFMLESTDAALPAINSRSDFTLVLGPWTHGVPETAKNNPLSQGVYLAWFDKWVRQDTTTPSFPKVIAYQSPGATTPSDQWRGFSTWPPAGLAVSRVYLADNAALSDSQPMGQSVSQYAVDGQGHSGELTYTGNPFAQPAVITGTVDLTLRISLSQPDGVIFAELQDVAPDGTATLMGVRTFLKASYRGSSVQPTPLVAGQPYDLKLQIPSKFWSIAAGHRLRLRLYSEDGGPPENTTAFTVFVSNGAVSFIDYKVMSPASF
jgi:uncharacterized protein